MYSIALKGKKENRVLVNEWSCLFVSFTILVSLVQFVIAESGSTFELLLISMQCAAWFLAFLFSGFRYSPTILLLYLIGCCSAVINTFVNGSGYGGMVSFISLLSGLIFLNAAEFPKMQLKKMLWWINILMICILLIFSKKDGVYYISWLSFVDRVVNPNGYAMVALSSCVMMTTLLYMYRDKIKRVTYNLIFIALIMLYLIVIYDTEARTSLMGLVIYVLAFWWAKQKRVDNYKLNKGLFTSIILLAIFGCIVYVLMYEVVGRSIEIFGKNLYTGRQDIWREAFEMILQNPIFGYSNHYLYEGIGLNVHNGYLAILGNLGLVPYIVFILLYVCKSKIGYGESSVIRTLFAARIACLFLAMFEAIFLDNLYFNFILLMSITRVVEEDKV